jgi:hypothetical protein
MTSPRLLLDIYRRGLQPAHAGADAARFTDIFLHRIEQAVPFVADNVADWFWHVRQGELDVSRDLPCQVPPYETTWIEWTNYWDPGCDRFGMLVQVSDYGDDEDGGTAAVTSRIMGMLANKTNVIGERAELTPAGPLRWLLYAMPIARSTGLPPVGPVKVWVAGLSSEGQVAPTISGHYCNFSIYPEGTTEEAAKAFSVMMTVGLLTLAFLNCRNVVAAEHLPTRQERRALQRQGLPAVIFRTVNIEPMKTVLRDEGRIAEVGLRRSLHICRGHFAHYGEDKPLFGKYSGQFWRPAHVRGNAEVGMVVKDYNVRAPKEDIARGEVPEQHDGSADAQSA